MVGNASNSIKPWKIVLAGIVIFASGVITGGVLVYAVTEHSRALWREQSRMLRPIPSPADYVRADRALGNQRILEERRIEFIRAAQRHLGLSEDQKRKIDEIIRQTQERTRQLLGDILPELRKEWDRAYQAILDELTPEQRARFMKLVRRWFDPVPARNFSSPNEEGSTRRAP